MQVWENAFDERDAPLLHQRRHGTLVLPEAALLGLALAAAARHESHSIEDVRFDEPMELDDGEPTAVQVSVEQHTGRASTISIYGRHHDEWTCHTRATVGSSSAGVPSVDTAATQALREGAARAFDTHDTSAFLSTGGLVVADNANRIDRLWCGDGALLAEVSPPAAGDETTAMLDACVQAASFAALAHDGATTSPMIPVYAGRVQMHGAWVDGASCFVRVQSPADADEIVVDVALLAPDGDVLATIDDLRLRSIARPADRPDEWFYGIEWQPITAPSADGPTVGHWVVVSDRRGYGDALAGARSSEDGTCAVVRADDDLATVVAAVDDAPQGGPIDVVYLRGLDAPPIDEVSGADLERVQRRVCGELLTLVRALDRASRPVRIHIVTRGLHRTSGDAHVPDAMQAPLWGLGRVVAEELPDMSGSLIDLDPETPPSRAVVSLVHELRRAGADGEVAWRGDQRFVARLVRRTPPASVTRQLRPDCTYLVTGGFGNLGAEVAQWLVHRGASRLVLVGRTELPPRAQWGSVAPDGPIGRRVALVRRLEALGAAVHVASVDVGDATQLRDFLDEFRAEGWPPIRGVVHTAAVFTSSLLNDLEPDSLWEQLRPKVVGAWTLSESLDELDQFVLYSSIAAVMPQPGQGAYVAANAFLDALAGHRAARGQPALSVNWGFWSGSGGGLLGEEWSRPIEQMESQGFRGFRADQGLDALARMVGDDAAQMVFVPIDWARYDVARAASPLVSQLIVQSRAARDDRAGTRPSTTVPERLADAAADERPQIVEMVVRRVVARVLRMPESSIDAAQPLGELGLDSLMGVELRNRLEAEFRVKLSATLAWNHPTVADLGAHLLAKLGFGSPAAESVDGAFRPAGNPSGPTPPPSASLDQLLAEADDMADEDALRALLRGTPR
jgi:NAD(P)-dependent dehydrogenase (short-subunit alcohol dehydrogenase family)/acyl carrier protein